VFYFNNLLPFGNIIGAHDYVVSAYSYLELIHTIMLRGDNGVDAGLTIPIPVVYKTCVSSLSSWSSRYTRICVGT